MGSMLERYIDCDYYLDGEKINLKDFLRSNHFEPEELFDIVNMNPSQTMKVGMDFTLYFGTQAPKKFMCYWGEGYKEQCELHYSDWFTDANGYACGLKDQIMELGLNKSLDLSDPGGRHIITRVR